MVAILVDDADNTPCGTLIVEDVPVQRVQDEIFDIKRRFYEEDVDDWTIFDVLKELPSHWKVKCNTKLLATISN